MGYIKGKKLAKLVCQSEKSSLIQMGILPGFRLLSTCISLIIHVQCRLDQGLLTSLT